MRSTSIDADDDVPRAVDLEETERIGHAERHLVPQLRAAERVADDEQVRH